MKYSSTLKQQWRAERVTACEPVNDESYFSLLIVGFRMSPEAKPSAS